MYSRSSRVKPSSDRLNTARAAVGACLGSGRAKFECILYGLGGLDGSPEGRTGGGGMGRAMRAGVRVGLFVCLCLCRERPPCEGFIPSVTAEGTLTVTMPFFRARAATATSARTASTISGCGAWSIAN